MAHRHWAEGTGPARPRRPAVGQGAARGTRGTYTIHKFLKLEYSVYVEVEYIAHFDFLLDVFNIFNNYV